jgi:hypothetical protein
MKKQAVLVILTLTNLILSVLIPTVIGELGWISPGEEILLGGVVWIVFTSTEILYYVSRIDKRDYTASQLWSAHDQIDNRLGNIRKYYYQILDERYDAQDLFPLYFDREIAQLEKNIQEATTKRELTLEEQHLDITRILLDSFSGGANDISRPVHFLKDNQTFLEMHYRQYFYDVARCVEQGKIKQVKRLMVFDDETQLSDPFTLRLVRFHASTKGFSYRLIDSNDYFRMLKDYDLHRTPADFGIYGSRYVYFTITHSDADIAGVFSKDPEVIKSHIQFFDGCFDSAAAFEIAIDDQTPVTLHSLFDQAVVQDNRHLQVPRVAENVETLSQAAPTTDSMSSATSSGRRD